MSRLVDNNFIVDTDSYKVSHYRQLPPGTKKLYSFFESRGGMYKEVTFFGLQYVLLEHLAGKVVTEEKIEEAKEICAKHFDDPTLFNEKDWRYILDEYDGHLPLDIRAVPEGRAYPTSNVLMTAVNTDDRLPHLTNYAETLLVQSWYPSTVTTLSREIKKTILAYLELTGDPASVQFKLHDFGFRGSTCAEAAGIGGTAHMVNFMGTDTMRALRVARAYYGEDMAGKSIYAAEHSTITSWGRGGEERAYRNMLEQFPTGYVAVVSDSYDIFKACSELWGGKLKDEVLARDGVLVIRPDSGDPATTVLKVIEILGDRFGTEINSKGYKVLHPKVRVIQGDGIDGDTVRDILWLLEMHDWSADNIAFGSGGGLLQKMDRDTQKFAFKGSAIYGPHGWETFRKEPITDKGKKSKAGRLALINDFGEYRTVAYQDDYREGDLLEPVFLNGKMLRTQNLAEIRQNALVGGL